jgi:tetratricopeptide (TPR) repeat protein
MSTSPRGSRGTQRGRHRSVSPHHGSPRRTSPRRAESAEELLRKADAERRRGTDAGYRAAIRGYDDALDRLGADGGQPAATVARALSSRASCCEALGEHGTALVDLNEALGLPVPRSRKSQLFGQRAELYVKMGKVELAEKDLRRAIQLSSGAAPGGLAYNSHTRATELLTRLTRTPEPEPEPESRLRAARSVIVAEFGPEDRRVAAGKNGLGISFESTAGGRGLRVTAIAIGSPAEHKYPELGPGCLLVTSPLSSLSVSMSLCVSVLRIHGSSRSLSSCGMSLG